VIDKLLNKYATEIYPPSKAPRKQKNRSVEPGSHKKHKPNEENDQKFEEEI
jgi:hypothetical protein